MTKRPEEIALMAKAGQLLASVFGKLDQCALIGMSTMQVNDMVDSFIVNELNARPASKGQYGYAYALNSSPNNVVCHGMPSTTDILRDGDIVNFDITLEKNGFIADSSKTYLVGEVSPNGSCTPRMKPCGEVSKPFAQGPGSVMSAMPSSVTPGAMVTPSSESTADTALAGKCTKPPKCCIGVNREPGCCFGKAWYLPLNRCLIRGADLYNPKTMAGRS